MSSGEIDAIWNLADRVLAKHMQDPNYLPLAERTEMLRDSYKRRPIDRLPEDVTRAFDRLARCERDRDKQQKTIIALESSLRVANLKIWILGAVVLAEGGTIGWLATELMKRLN